jgi:hypothetical protein
MHKIALEGNLALSSHWEEGPKVLRRSGSGQTTPR